MFSGWNLWAPNSPPPKGWDWVWLHASATMFWLALAMFGLSARDLVSVLIHNGVRPPTQDDLSDGNDRPIRRRANRVRGWSVRHRALIGLGGIVFGGLFGHF